MNFLRNLFRSSQQEKKEDEEDIVVLPGHNEFKLEVVGESYYQDSLTILAQRYGIKKDVTARLVMEDENPKDKNAVRVEIDGNQVGYLSKEVAKIFRGILIDNKHPHGIGECQARIFGGYVKDGKKTSYGVWLDIPVEFS